MRIRCLFVMIAGIFFLAAPALAVDWSADVLAGYQGGLSFKTSGGVSSFARGFPLGLELGLAYAIVDPGDPFPARRVFIQNATNGTPEKHGSIWDFRLDFLYPLQIPAVNLSVLAGPRFSLFDAHFHYVGANEEFDVTSNQWGLGLGVKGSFAISQGLRLVVQAGLDYFFPGPLEGHDTVYTPDNQNVNPIANYTYRDAAATVNAPEFVPALMLGLGF